MNKFMVTATFTEENMKNGRGKSFVGTKQHFYCGDDKTAAEEIYNRLPNADKTLVSANVSFASNIHPGMIFDYEVLEVIR